MGINNKAEEIAARLRSTTDWNMFDCMDLCDLAEMHDEYMNTSPFEIEENEKVVREAAKKLNVEI